MLYGDIESRVSGGSTNEIDHFNRTSLDYYSGDTGAFNIDGTTTWEGSGALHSDTSAADNYIGADGSTSVPGTISQGGSWSFRVRSTVSSGGTTFGRMASMWAIGDITAPSQNCYYIDFRPDADRVQLAKIVNGTGSTLVRVDVTNYTAGDWLYIEATWASDDTISFTVYEEDVTTKIGSNSTVDTDHSGVNNTVGWYSLNESGDEAWADHCSHI